MKSCRCWNELPAIALGVLAALSCLAACAQTSPQDPPSRPPQTSRPDETVGPRLAEPLPGTTRTRLTSNAQYVSTLISRWSSERSPSTSSQLAEYYRSRSRANMLRVPEMFGDFRAPGNSIRVAVGTLGTLETEIPAAAGIGGLKIAEDNQALPADRFWIAHNYFRNAFDYQPQGAGAAAGQTQSLHRILIAREFLLDEGRTSIEVRLPFGAAVNASGLTIPATATSGFEVESDSIGNLSLILKRLLYADRCLAFSVGLGVETPTGNSGEVTVAGQRVIQDVDAVHLVPYLALTERVDRWFGHAFAQLDVATGGDDLLADTGLGTAVNLVGQIDPAPRLGLDLGIGYWLRKPCCQRSWGIATMAELHYTTALSGSDSFVLTNGTTTLGINAPAAPPRDLLNATAGVVISGGNGWSMRFAIAAPLRDQRIFDTETIFQLNRAL